MVSLLAALVGLQGGLDPSNDVFMDGDKAYLLAPPQVVADFTNDTPIWSSDGKYVLCSTLDFSLAGLAKAIETQKPPEATWNLVLWSSATRKSTVATTIKTSLDRMPTLRDVGWLKGAPTAYGILETTEVTPEGRRQVVQLLRVSPGGKPVLVDMANPGERPSITFSTKTPVAFIVAGEPTQTPDGVSWQLRLTALGANGPTGSETIKDSAINAVGLSNDGRSAVILKSKGQNSIQPAATWDPANGLKPTNEAADFEPPAETGRLKLAEEPVQVGRDASKTSIQALWIMAPASDKTPKEDKTSTLVATESPLRLASLSPKGDAVLYVSRGVTMVRNLVEVPLALLKQAKGGADRTKAISDAKQCALAAIMFAADNDDEMPKSGDIDKLHPYLQNREILSKFVYTFQGGNLSELKNPESTEIGYVEGPGGRAVAYADGHVKWVPN